MPLGGFHPRHPQQPSQFSEIQQTPRSVSFCLYIALAAQQAVQYCGQITKPPPLGDGAPHSSHVNSKPTQRNQWKLAIDRRACPYSRLRSGSGKERTRSHASPYERLPQSTANSFFRAKELGRIAPSNRQRSRHTPFAVQPVHRNPGWKWVTEVPKSSMFSRQLL